MNSLRQITIYGPERLASLLPKQFHVELDNNITRWLAEWGSGVTEDSLVNLRLSGESYVALIRKHDEMTGVDISRLEVKTQSVTLRVPYLDGEGCYVVHYNSTGPNREAVEMFEKLIWTLERLAEEWGINPKELKYQVLDNR